MGYNETQRGGHMRTFIGDYRFTFDSSKRIFPNEAYADYEQLGYKKDRDFSEEMPLLVKPNGEAAFHLTESIPTFDAGDREYDSYHELYLMRELGQWKGIFVGSGYVVGKVEIYSNIRGDDAESEKLLERFAQILDSRKKRSLWSFFKRK